MYLIIKLISFTLGHKHRDLMADTHEGEPAVIQHHTTISRGTT